MSTSKGGWPFIRSAARCKAPPLKAEWRTTTGFVDPQANKTRPGREVARQRFAISRRQAAHVRHASQTYRSLFAGSVDRPPRQPGRSLHRAAILAEIIQRSAPARVARNG